MNKFTKKQVQEYLSTLGNVNQFYITMLNGPGSEVIHYILEDNTAWCLMEDNTEMVNSCISYLKSTSTPILSSIDELRNYEKLMGIK